jgi:hypothetical protein
MASGECHREDSKSDLHGDAVVDTILKNCEETTFFELRRARARASPDSPADR